MNLDRLEHHIVDQGIYDLSTWPEVDTGSLTDDDEILFSKRKNAIDLYFQGKKLDDIQELTEIKKSEIYRLVKRCILESPNGYIYGYNALIPYFRIKKYEKSSNKSKGDAGRLSCLFQSFPDIESYVIDLFFGKNIKGELKEAAVRFTHVYDKFLGKCISEGIQQNEYPFNTVSQGREGLRRYLNEHAKTSPRKYLHSIGGEELANEYDATKFYEYGTVIKPYEIVQFDATKIDALFIIHIPAPDGTLIPLVLERIWLLTIIDVGSRDVLGYSISLSRQYSSIDVLDCVWNSIKPWSPMVLTIPNLKYKEGGGLPSGTIDGCEWRLYNTLCMDNALPHLSSWTQDRINKVVKCSINIGPSFKKQARGVVERFFKTMNDRGFHRIKSTTGSNLQDYIRKNPELNAKKYEIEYSELEQVVDVLIADYGATPHTSIHGRKPLDLIRYHILEDKYLTRSLAPDKRENNDLFTKTFNRTVRGGTRRDPHAPYIYFEGAKYQSNALSNSLEYVGQKLRLHVNMKDLRVIKAFYQNGSFFGELQAKFPWNLSKHSLKTRQAINSCTRKKIFSIGNEDPIIIYNNYLLIKSRSSKKHRNELKRVELEKEYINATPHDDENTSTEDISNNYIKKWVHINTID